MRSRLVAGGVCFILMSLMLSLNHVFLYTNAGTSWQVCSDPPGKESIFSSDYPSHAPIHIDSNLDFETQGWPGNGTVAEPYEINGYSIVHTDTCITITGVTVSFVIRNCSLINTNLQAPSSGIIVDSPAIVEDCTITAPFGVWLNGENNTVQNCRMIDCWDGVRMDDAHGSNVTGCIMTDVYTGIFNVHSTGCLFDGNTVSNCDQGVLIRGPDCIVKNNLITDALWGIQIDEPDCLAQNNTIIEKEVTGYSAIIIFGSYCKLIDNSVFGDLRISGRECTLINNELDDFLIFTDDSYEMWNHTLIDNTVNGEPIHFARDQVDQEFDASQYGQIILLDCSNCIIRDAHSQAPIMVGYSDNIIIKNNVIRDTDFGPTFTGVVNSTICDNILRGDSWGLNIKNSFNCTIERNVIRNGIFGVSLHHCNNLTFRYNEITNCRTAIELGFSYYCQIYNNTFVENTEWGINAPSPPPSTLYVLAITSDETPQQTTGISWNNFIDNPKNAEDNSQKI
ncbi:MAG: right-handed parallel beta-helix repeat-containing protein, partial [Promethearchaeota archaeon]